MSLAACTVAKPVIKIGLVAPFEGRYRDVGYEVIYAVRLAVREANARGGVAGHMVELVALDDGGDADVAITQAQKMALDPQVMAVIGHWLDATTEAAAPAYVAANVPLLSTTGEALPEGVFRLWPEAGALEAALPIAAARCPAPCGWIDGAQWLEEAAPGGPVAGSPLWAFPQMRALAGPSLEGAYVPLPAPLPAETADPEFAERYRAISNGVEPGAYAVLAYDAANAVFAAMERSADLTREDVASALGAVEYQGLSGMMRFGEPAGGNVWVYRWENDALALQP